MTSSTRNYCKTSMQVRWQMNRKHDDHPCLCLHLYHLSELLNMREEGLIFQENPETGKMQPLKRLQGCHWKKSLDSFVSCTTHTRIKHSKQTLLHWHPLIFLSACMKLGKL